MTLIRDGDEEAAYELYQRYSGRLYALVRAKTGSKLAALAEPEDIVQSTFKSVLKRMQAGAYNAPAGSTLWNLLAVVATHKLSKKATHHSAQRRNVDRKVSLEGMEEGLPPDGEQDPSETFEVCMHEALSLLRPADRDVLTYRIEGYSVSEISERTGRSLRSVERSLQKMRERLATHLLGDSAALAN